MTPTSAKRPALICVAPDLQGTAGHTSYYLEIICGAAEEFFEQVLVLAPRDCRVNRTGLCPVLPPGNRAGLNFFRGVRTSRPDSGLQASGPGSGGWLRPALVTGLGLWAAFNLDRHLQRLAPPGSQVFFEHAHSFQIKALARMAVGRRAGLIEAWHVLLRMPPETMARGFRSEEALFAALNGLVDRYGDKINFYTDTRRLTQAYQQGLRHPDKVRTLPLVPLNRLEGGRARGIRSELRLGYMGEARLDKGYGRLPWLYERLPGTLAGRRVRLVIQTDASPRHRAATAPVTRWLSSRPADPARPELELLADLSPARYALSYSDLDISLLLYEDRRYRFSSSGIMAEAVEFGVPVLCYDWSSMADLLAEAAGRGPEAGLAVGELREAPAAIERLAENIDDFKAAMEAFGRWWLPDQSPGNLVRQLLVPRNS